MEDARALKLRVMRSERSIEKKAQTLNRLSTIPKRFVYTCSYSSWTKTGGIPGDSSSV
jgi:biotin synthase-related radical SAM superfamily protein